ncbi:sulfatase-like hydrolase/transferase [Candidatus Poribacteria bacterium]
MANRPNVLFLLSDEHSFRHMNFRDAKGDGEPVSTPNLDSLAENGVYFDQSYCQMPLCTPSRMCLLSGRDVRGCGAWSNGSVMREDVRTFAHDFADNGYETCLVGKMHFGDKRQFNGFMNRPYGDLTGKCGHQSEPLKPEGGARDGMRERTSCAGVTMIPESVMQEEILCRESLTFLRELRHSSEQKPWLLCASFSRPHFPLNAPRRHFERYWPDGVTPPKVGRTGDTIDHPMTRGMMKGFRTEEIGREEAMKARAAYFANVDFLDEIIGDFLALMERDGFLDNTIIVYTTDHGELAGEHGLWWKHSWHEAAVRVPFIIQTPEHRRGGIAPSYIDTPVSLGDLYPTLCALGGLPVPEKLYGQNLAPAVLEGTEPESRPVYCDNLVSRWGEGTEFRMIREGKYKYVGFRNAPELLFDVEADPLEQKDLAGFPDDEIKERLEHFRSLMEATMDFDAAEDERKKDTQMKRELALEIPHGTGNNFLMPDGRLVNADDMLYSPTVLSDNPGEDFDDWPYS